MMFLSFSLLLPLLTLSSILIAAAPIPPPLLLPRQVKKPTYFLLVGDSTTAKPKNQSYGITGGWGDGFLSTLAKPASGTNYGHNGRTTVDYRSGGDWDAVMKDLKANREKKDIYVTIQFGHNDVKAVPLPDFQSNLQKMAQEIKAAGATPILVTPLSQRYFANNKVRESLAAQAKATVAAADAGKFNWIDLHAESMKYLNGIGEQAALKLSPVEADKTHLSPKGTIVFGRMVADLVAGKVPNLKGAFVVDAPMSAAIRDGKAIP